MHETHKMTEPDWSLVKFFKKREFDKPCEMNRDFVFSLDSFREDIKTEILVTYSTNGVHSENSEHYKGNAVDVMFPKYTGNLFDLYLLAEKHGFTGIGIYPKWKIKNNVIGGIHLDKRHILTKGSRWIGYPVKVTEKGKTFLKQKYFKLDTDNLKKYKII